RNFISDLGLACEDGQTMNGSLKGVIPYVAPEVLACKPHTKPTDIYSFGIAMWECTSCQPPFHNMDFGPDLVYDVYCGLRPPIIKGTPESYVQLMMQCWDPDPEKRPTAHILAETLENGS
ncbi:12240_t:CDS:1, partial [Acaulospora morrowiae]